MSALNQVIASYPPPGMSFVGMSFFLSPGTAVNYPTGTQPGDLVIVVQHWYTVEGTPTTPTGFTAAFTTAGDTNSYAKKVSYKIAGVETSVTVPKLTNTNFQQEIFTFRNAASVNASGTYNYASSGGSNSITTGYAGTTVLVASDRGDAPSVAVPTLTSTGRTNLSTTTSTFFGEAAGIYLNQPSSLNIGYTDTSNNYGTSGLFFRVQ